MLVNYFYRYSLRSSKGIVNSNCRMSIPLVDLTFTIHTRLLIPKQGRTWGNMQLKKYKYIFTYTGSTQMENVTSPFLSNIFQNTTL